MENKKLILVILLVQILTLALMIEGRIWSRHPFKRWDTEMSKYQNELADWSKSMKGWQSRYQDPN